MKDLMWAVILTACVVTPPTSYLHRAALSGMPDTVLATDTFNGHRMVLLDTHARRAVTSGV